MSTPSAMAKAKKNRNQNQRQPQYHFKTAFKLARNKPSDVQCNEALADEEELSKLSFVGVSGIFWIESQWLTKAQVPVGVVKREKKKGVSRREPLFKTIYQPVFANLLGIDLQSKQAREQADKILESLSSDAKANRSSDHKAKTGDDQLLTEDREKYYKQEREAIWNSSAEPSDLFH